MRIEKLSENKIKCILERDDLISRGIKISELAYGSEKTKELFHEMMQQASTELGFEAEDNPLMIEAIPTMEKLILVITKVDDPDELDSRFSRFTPDPLEGFFEEDTEDFDPSEDDNIFIPLAQTLAPVQPEEKPEDDKASQKQVLAFSFRTLSEVCDVCTKLVSIYDGISSVYKDPHHGTYYLLVAKGKQSSEDFGKICRLLSEYGKVEHTSYASKAYMAEHFELISKDHAIEILGCI